MKQYPALPGKNSGFLHRENDTGFVVAPHNGSNGRIRCQAFFVGRHIQISLFVHGDFRDPVSVIGQVFAKGFNGRMLHAAGHDMALIGVQLEGGPYGGIVTLRPATGEQDFFRINPQKFSHTFTGITDLFADLSAKGMGAGRIAV